MLLNKKTSMGRISKILIWIWIILTVTFVISQFHITKIFYILNWIYAFINVVAIFGLLTLLRNNKKENEFEYKDEL